MLYLLDTNTCIAAMRNHPLVVQKMAAISPGGLCDFHDHGL
jgi:predicted nucleic acid-binding protein